MQCSEDQISDYALKVFAHSVQDLDWSSVEDIAASIDGISKKYIDFVSSALEIAATMDANSFCLEMGKQLFTWQLFYEKLLSQIMES
jgi:hypothetical protein